MMTGDKVSADDAKQMGMIYKVFANETFIQEVMVFANTMADMPTKGLGLTKRLLNESLFNNLETQLAGEDREQLAAANTYDYNEGVSAFLEKRKPEFKGE
jgi:2-(1,2-epoxy-1,2-dihydrophenyl)acetyl-CoA isomerase